MRFAVVGGDMRSVWLARLLKNDGHGVHTYALEKADVPGTVLCLQGCTYSADALVLPIPTLREGYLTAPLSDSETDPHELSEALWPGQHIFGMGESIFDEVMSTKIRWHDMGAFPGFTELNSALTAEGAVAKLMESSPRSIYGSRILITGSGNLSRALRERLISLGGRVTVCARHGGDTDFSSLPETAGEYDFILNTVPSRVIDTECIERIRQDTPVLELASAPYGINIRAARKRGLMLTVMPGIPGKTAPLTEAEFLKDGIYKVLEAENGQ